MIFLFAGHNLSDPGATGIDGVTEAELTMEFSDLVFGELPSEQVIRDDNRESLTKLISRIKPGSGSVLLDCHFNSAGKDSTGIEAFIANEANADSRAFATDLVVTGTKTLGLVSRGVKTEKQSNRTRLGILHTGAGISALIELAFISNPEDLKRYHANKYALAKQYAGLLLKWDAVRF